MSNGDILVTFGALQQAEGDIASTSSALNQELADLKAYLAPLVASWTGVASTDYQAKQREWDTAAADLNRILSQIGVAVGKAEQNYSQAESTNARMWS